MLGHVCMQERVTLELQRTREDSDGSSNSDQVSTMLQSSIQVSPSAVCW